MDCLNDWTVANWISFWSLLISIVTAIFLVGNFFLGQKQTKTALAINQFNIYNGELKDLIEEARKVRFKSDLKEPQIYPERIAELEKSDGILYITLFLIADTNGFSSNASIEAKTQHDSTITDFRHNVLFPLGRFYDKLLYYLNSIKEDSVLLPHYKKIIFTKVEKDILQTYLRVCNNKGLSGRMIYNLLPFKTEAYDPSTFYRINEFYINNNLFQFKNLKFYIDTL